MAAAPSVARRIARAGGSRDSDPARLALPPAISPGPLLWGLARRALLGISPAQATFGRRRFRAGVPSVREHLERVGRTFVDGYNAALMAGVPDDLGARLGRTPSELRGFAFEGAAMALTLLDRLTPRSRRRSRRFNQFIRGLAADHIYMAHIGAGWAFARLGSPLDRLLPLLDPLLRWLTVDGYGFHEAYFKPRRTVALGTRPSRLSGYERRAFDQGVGRALWFVTCADVRHVANAVARFDPARRPDLWSGVGLACAYAGGAGTAAVAELAAAAMDCRPELAQGVAFAAKARLRAGNLTPHTSLACEILCGTSAAGAAAVTDAALEDLPFATDVPAYEVWRRRIATRFASRFAAAASPEVTG